MKKRYQRNHFKAFSNSVNKKKLYKKGKNWVVGSLTLLALAGLGVTADHTVHADGDANTKAATTSVGSTADIEHKAKAMYNGMIANQIANPSAGQPTQKGTTKLTSAKSNVASSSASQSSQSSSKANSVSAEMTAPSTANKTTSSAKTTTPVKPGLGGANPLAKNQSTSTSSQGSANPSASNSNSSVTPSLGSSNGVNVKAAKSASQSASADQSPIAKAAALHNAVDKHNLNAVKPKRELGGGVPPTVLEGFLNNYGTTINNDLSKANTQYNQANKTASLDNDHRQINSDAQDFNNFKNIYKNSNGNFGYDSAMGKYNAFMNDYQNFENDVKTAVTPTDPLAKKGEQLKSVQNSLNTHYVSEINSFENGISHPSNDILNAYQVFNQWVNHFNGAVGHFNDMHNEAKEFQSMYPGLAQEDIQKALNSYEDAKSTVISQIGPAYTNYLNTYNSYKHVVSLGDQVESLSNDNNLVAHEESLINQYTGGISYSNLNSLSANLTNDSKALSTDYSSVSGDYSTLINHLNNTVLTSANAMINKGSLASSDFSNKSNAYNDTLLNSLSNTVSSENKNSSASSLNTKVSLVATKFSQTPSMESLSGDISTENASISTDSTQISNDYDSLKARLAPKHGLGASEPTSTPIETFGEDSKKANNDNKLLNTQLIPNYNLYMNVDAPKDNTKLGTYMGLKYSYDKIHQTLDFYGGKPDTNNLSYFLVRAFQNTGNPQKTSTSYATGLPVEINSDIQNARVIIFDKGADLTNVTNMSHMFSTNVDWGGGDSDDDVDTNLNALVLRGFNMNHDAPVNMQGMFSEEMSEGRSNFGGSGITILPSDFDIKKSMGVKNSSLSDTAEMFRGGTVLYNGTNKSILNNLVHSKDQSDAWVNIVNFKDINNPSNTQFMFNMNNYIKQLINTNGSNIHSINLFPHDNSDSANEGQTIQSPSLKNWAIVYSNGNNRGKLIHQPVIPPNPPQNSQSDIVSGYHFSSTPDSDWDMGSVSTAYIAPIHDGLIYTYDGNGNVTFTSANSSDNIPKRTKWGHVNPYNDESAKVPVLGDPYSDYSHFNNFMSTEPSDVNQIKNAKTITFDTGTDFSNINNMSNMLSDEPNLTKVTLPSDIDTSNVTNMSNMFANDHSLTNVSIPTYINTGNVTNMSGMFNGDKALKSVPLSGQINTSNVNDVSNMFANDPQITTDDYMNTVHNWYFSNDDINSKDMLKSDNNIDNAWQAHSVSNGTPKEIHNHLLNPQPVPVIFTYYDWLTGKQLSDKGLHKKVSITSSFYPNSDVSNNPDNDNLPVPSGYRATSDYMNLVNDNNNLAYQQFSVNGNTTNKFKVFVAPSSAQYGHIDSDDPKSARYYLSGQNLSFADGQLEPVNPSNYMENANPTTINFVGDWYNNHNGATKVYAPSDSSNLFANLYNSINTTKGINGVLDTSTAHNMSGMFANDNTASDINSMVSDLDKWNTSNVTNMSNMFNNMSSMKRISISNFNTDKVTNFSGMFQNDPALTSLDVSNFNTSKATDMSSMFANDENISNIKGLNNFDTNNVTDMHNMFNGIQMMPTLDLSKWQTPNVTNMQGMFGNMVFTNDYDEPLSNYYYPPYQPVGLHYLNINNFDTRSAKNQNNLTKMFANDQELQHLVLGPNTLLTGNDFVTPYEYGHVPFYWVTVNVPNKSSHPSDYYSLKTGNSYEGHFNDDDNFSTNNDFATYYLNDGKSHPGDWTRDGLIMYWTDNDNGQELNELEKSPKSAEIGIFKQHGLSRYKVVASDVDNDLFHHTVINNSAKFNLPTGWQARRTTITPVLNGQTLASLLHRVGNINIQFVDIDNNQPVGSPISMDNNIGANFNINNFKYSVTSNAITNDSNGQTYNLPSNYYLMHPYPHEDNSDISDSIITPAGQHSANVPTQFTDKPATIYVGVINPNDSQASQPTYVEILGGPQSKEFELKNADGTSDKGSVLTSDKQLEALENSALDPNNDPLIKQFINNHYWRGYDYTTTSPVYNNGLLVDEYGAWTEENPYKIHVTPHDDHVVFHYYDTTTGHQIYLPEATTSDNGYTGQPDVLPLAPRLRNHLIDGYYYVLDGNHPGKTNSDYFVSDVRPQDNTEAENNNNIYYMEHLNWHYTSDRIFNIYIKQVGNIKVHYLDVSDPSKNIYKVDSIVRSAGTPFNVHNWINNKPYKGYHLATASDLSHNDMNSNIIYQTRGNVPYTRFSDNDIGGPNGLYTQHGPIYNDHEIDVYYARDTSNIHVHYINSDGTSVASSDNLDNVPTGTSFNLTTTKDKNNNGLIKTVPNYHNTGKINGNLSQFSKVNGATNDVYLIYAPDRGNAEVNYIDDATGKSIKTVDSDFRSDGTWNVSDYFKPGQVSDSWKYTGKVSDNVSDGSGHNSVTPGLNFNTKSLNIPDNKDDKGKITLNIYVHQPKSTVTVHYVTKGADGKYDQSVGLANVTTTNATGANFNVSPYDNKMVSGYHRVGASDLTNNYPATDKTNADVYIKYDPNHSYIHVHYIEPSDNNKVLANSDNVSDNDVTKNTSFDINNYLNENFANKSDYTQKSIINPVTQFSKNNGDVENVYVPYSRKRSTITVNYFDMSDNQPLSDPEIFHSDVNNSFNVGNHEKSFNNYTQDHIINGSVNKFTDNDQTIDIFYRRNSGTIKVQYLDATNHDHLLSTVSSSNKVGNPFDINDYVNKPINGYHEQSVDANGIDQFKSGIQTATVYYAPNTANIHVYYEDADTGREISGYPESLASSATNASFNVAPYVKPINGYHFINSMHPATSYDANNDETHTIDLLYAPNSGSSTNTSSATDTINYLISGTDSAVAPSSTDSVEFSRAVSSASGQALSYGKWMTNSAFAPVTYNSVITSNGVRYQEVSANTAVPTPNMASDDFNANRIASFSNDIYYVPAKANVHVYFEAESDGHQLASQSDFTSSVNASFSLANYENRFNNAGYHYVTALHPADTYDPNTGEVHTIDLLYAKNNQTTSNVAPENATVTETTYDEWNNGRTNVSEAASATTYHYTRNGSLVYDPATKNYSDHYSDWKLLNNSSTSNRLINLNGYYYETTVGNLPSAATLQNLAPNANVSYSDYQLYAPNSASYTNSAVSGAATETVNYYENGSLVSTATYTSGVNLNRNALVSANNHNYVVDPGEWRVASGRGFALPASASFAGYYATSSNGNVPLNTLNVDPGNYSENVYYSPAKANIHVYYENADNGSELAKPSEFTSSVNVPFQMSTLGDYKNEFDNANYHFVGLMHPASNYDPNNNETHTIDLLYAPNQPAKHQANAYSSIHVHYIDSDNQPVTVNGRVSDNFNNRQAGTAFTMPHISDVTGYQSGNENVINPVTKFSSDNGSVTNVYVQYHKVVPGVQPITVNYLSSDNTKLGSAKYTNANTTMSDIQKDINGRTFNNYTHVNTLNMPSGFTTHPQTVYVIYRPDHPVTHRGHIHVRYVDENNHDREFWSDKFSDNPGTPFDLRIDNYAVRYVPDRTFDKVISGYTPGHPINFGNQSATDPYVIVVGYAKPKPKSSASATPSSTASSASSKASSASSKASSSVAPSASSSVSSSASQPSSSASRMSSAPVIPSSQASSQSSVAPQHRSARATNNQPKLKTKQTKPVYIPKNGKGRAIRRQMIREIEKLENLIDQDIRAIQSRVVAVHKYDEHAHKQQMVHEIHIKREDLAKKEVHLRKLKAHKLPQTGESQSYSAMYAMLFVLSSVILAGLGKAIEKRRHE